MSSPQVSTPVKSLAGPPVNGSGVLPTVRLTSGGRQRRPGYIALLVVLVVGLGAVAGWLYYSAGQKTPVVVMVGHVPAGQQIDRADLSTVSIAGGVTAISGANLDSVVGRVAAVELLPGTIVQRSMVADRMVLPAGQSQVGVLVAPGSFPVDGLAPGDTVRVLSLPAKETVGGATTAAVLADRAVVFAAHPADSAGSGLLVTVTVSDAQSGPIAVVSGAGRVALVKVSS